MAFFVALLGVQPAAQVSVDQHLILLYLEMMIHLLVESPALSQGRHHGVKTFLKLNG